MVSYMSTRLAETALLIGSSNLDRQFAPTTSGPFDTQGIVVGPQGLNRRVQYMFRWLGKGALLTGSTVLSKNSHLDRQFASRAPGAFDSRGSLVGPQGLDIMVFYMSRRLAESALSIVSTVLSNNSNSHRQFAPTTSGPFDSRGSVV
jgi:hypothetical protein